MNHATDERRNPTPWDQAKIDRLVDGEASAAEYQELLTQFENHPDGWRACAIAFLESQAWRAAMQGSPRSVENRDIAPPHHAKDGPRWIHLTRRASWSPLAVAATIAVAFLAGRLTTEPASSVEDAGTSSLVQKDPSSAIAPGTDPSLRFANHGMLDGQPAIHPHDRQSLGKMGVQVSQENGYLLMTTDEGKPFLLPFEDVKLIPVNHRPY